MKIDLHLGDCLEFLKTLEDGSVDAVVTDPPYGVRFQNKSWDTEDGFADNCRIWLQAMRRVSSCVAFTPGLVNVATWAKIEEPKWILCWHKPAAMKRSPFGFCNWDAILFYGKSKNTFGFSDVITAPIIVEPFDHPTIKPLDLMVGIIERCTKPGDTVIDPFMGSGTTGVAAIRLGRNFIGCEINPEYFAVAQKRINAAIAADAALLPTFSPFSVESRRQASLMFA